MSKHNNGGPAYPTYHERKPPCLDAGMSVDIGLTKRDYFAGQALAGMLSYYNEHRGDYHTNAPVEVAAKDAYQYADAMLKAREESPNDE